MSKCAKQMVKRAECKTYEEWLRILSLLRLQKRLTGDLIASTTSS